MARRFFSFRELICFFFWKEKQKSIEIFRLLFSAKSSTWASTVLHFKGEQTTNELHLRNVFFFRDIFIVAIYANEVTARKKMSLSVNDARNNPTGKNRSLHNEAYYYYSRTLNKDLLSCTRWPKERGKEKNNNRRSLLWYLIYQGGGETDLPFSVTWIINPRLAFSGYCGYPHTPGHQLNF